MGSAKQQPRLFLLMLLLAPQINLSHPLKARTVPSPGCVLGRLILRPELTAAPQLLHPSSILWQWAGATGSMQRGWCLIKGTITVLASSTRTDAAALPCVPCQDSPILPDGQHPAGPAAPAASSPHRLHGQEGNSEPQARSKHPSIAAAVHIPTQADARSGSVAATRLFASQVFAGAGRGLYLERSNIWGKGSQGQKKYYRCIRVIKQTPTDQRAQGKGCELIWQRQAEVVMRAGQGGHLWKLYYLQILGFPLMGNFTTVSWGFVQIKTNGDPDSWLRSGYCGTQTHTYRTESGRLLWCKKELGGQEQGNRQAVDYIWAVAAQTKPV